MIDVPARVRPLNQDAGPAWLSLVNEGLQDCPGFEPRIPLDYQRLRSGDSAGGPGAQGGRPPGAGLTLGAEHRGELAGAATLIFGSQRGRLRNLIVRPDMRRCGIGTRLVEAALDRIRRHGLHLAEAQDWDVPPFRAFYGALGFRPVRRYLFLRWDLAAPLPALPVDPEVTVRRATLLDLEEISDLYTHMYTPYWDWSRDGAPEQVRDEYRSRFAERLGDRESDRTYLLAVLRDRLVGGITARVDQAHNQATGAARGSLNPGGAGVLPAYRRCGIGSRLLAEALALLRMQGMDQVTVWTFSYLDSDAPAVLLYRRAGAKVAQCRLGWEKAL